MRGVFCYYLIIKGKARRAGHNPGAEVGGLYQKKKKKKKKKKKCEDFVKIKKRLDLIAKSGIIVIRRKGNLRKTKPHPKFGRVNNLGESKKKNSERVYRPTLRQK